MASSAKPPEPSGIRGRSSGSPRPRRRPRGRFSRREERAVTLLCAIYALRIVGLYMVLPVLSPYAASLEGATGILTGMAIGAYGLTQGIFQIPFGSLSDRIGRKRTLVLGLGLFAAGSAIAGLADSIHVLILGRLVQGMGAIASVVVAFAADLTRAQVRTQAMARIGIWVGGAFAIGMTTGPFVAAGVGVPALFWATAVLSVLGAVQLMIGVPEPRRRRPKDSVAGAQVLPEADPASCVDSGGRPPIGSPGGPFDGPPGRPSKGSPGRPSAGSPAGPSALSSEVRPEERDALERVKREDIRYILGQPTLLLLDVGTFLLHLTLTAIFVILPVAFEREFGSGRIGWAVVPIVLLGLGTMLGTATYSDRTGSTDRVFFLGGGLFLLACATLGLWGTGTVGSMAGLAVFVLAVACLEPILPALTSRFAVGPHRGAAMGVFHMSQFLGSFFGGLVGGAFLERSLALPFLGLGGLVAVWLLASRSIGRWSPDAAGDFG